VAMKRPLRPLGLYRLVVGSFAKSPTSRDS
jgi:hypothetical protein